MYPRNIQLASFVPPCNKLRQHLKSGSSTLKLVCCAAAAAAVLLNWRAASALPNVNFYKCLILRDAVRVHGREKGNTEKAAIGLYMNYDSNRIYTDLPGRKIFDCIATEFI